MIDLIFKDFRTPRQKFWDTVKSWAFIIIVLTILIGIGVLLQKFVLCKFW